MRIAVCFKIVPDYDSVPNESWRGNGVPNFRFAKKNFGFFDEGALETALKLKDDGAEVYLEAVCLGKSEPIFTEKLYAAGYDCVTWLKNRCDDFDSSRTASILSDYLKNGDFDFILTGEAACPAETGYVPYALADKMGISVLDRVTGMSYRDGAVCVRRESAFAYEEYILSAPAVLIVSNAEKPYLRFSSFKQREDASKRPSASALIKTPAASAPVRVHLGKSLRKTRRIDFIGGSVEEKADALIKLIGGDGQ